MRDFATSRQRWSLAVGLLTALVVSKAQATVLMDLPLDQLTSGADAVVRGTVVKSGVRLILQGDDVVPTTVSYLQVHELIKGTVHSDVIEIREIGGKVDDLALIVDGTPGYQVGEQVVAFLHREKGEAERYRTHQMALGKFRIMQDRVTGKRTAVRDLFGASAAHTRPDGQLSFADDSPAQVWQADDLLASIRRALKNGAKP